MIPLLPIRLSLRYRLPPTRSPRRNPRGMPVQTWVVRRGTAGSPRNVAHVMPRAAIRSTGIRRRQSRGVAAHRANQAFSKAFHADRRRTPAGVSRDTGGVGEGTTASKASGPGPVRLALVTPESAFGAAWPRDRALGEVDFATEARAGATLSWERAFRNGLTTALVLTALFAVLVWVRRRFLEESWRVQGAGGSGRRPFPRSRRRRK